MKKKKILAVLVALLLVVGAGVYTYARYTFSRTGSEDVDVATWAVALKQGGSPVSDNFTLNLTLGANNNVVNDKIAPDRSATATLVLDLTGTEVATDYEIDLSTVTGLPDGMTITGVTADGEALSETSTGSGVNAHIKTSAYGDIQSFTTTTTDLYDSSQTITTTYSNGRYGNTNVGYMYNPAKVISVYPNKTPGSATANRLNYFPTFRGISNATNYYFFKNFDPNTDCFTGSGTDETGACTLKCRSLGNDGDSGIDCVQSNWNTLATTSGNYSTTDPGVYSTQYIYKSDYKYTCWGYGTPVTKSNGDGTTSVYITCPVVSEIVGTVNNQPTQAKVKYRGLFSADATTANTNVKDSKIKSDVDTWYATNILNANDGNGNALEDYLSDEIFCNDRSSTSTDFPLVNSDSYLYGPYNRNTASNRVPSFKCPNKSNDAFTLKTSGGVSSVTASGYGNNKLTYPVGLITIDEAAYAGGKNGSLNYKYYLYTGELYWTMSPSRFYADNLYAYVWSVNSSGYLYNSFSASAYGVRPVVNLRSDVLYSGGTGTESDPYIIELPSGT